MERTARSAITRRLESAWLRFHSWSAVACDWFYPYRPRVYDWRFWAIQLLVVVIAGTHTSLEILRSQGHITLVGTSPAVPFLSFIPVSLFVIPVVWAALGFGLPGALATAAWCTLLTVPNFFLHPGAERVREVWQMGLVDLVAVFVGQRVDREFAARVRAQNVTNALRASEVRFRSLFESSPVSVLVVRNDGGVLDANPAASSLFGISPDALRGRDLSELVCGVSATPPDPEKPVPPGDQACVIRRTDGTERLVEPVVTRIPNEGGDPYLQVLLIDVTEERRRQVGLRAFAARILKAQEEERKRIAQELHDETIQSLILLCRRLDMVEGESALSPSASQDLGAARSSAEKVVEGLRGFARVLRPPTLDELGLVAAIRRLLTDAGDRSHFQTRLLVSGVERRLAPDAELGLYRIVQEALRNVERHAGATLATVKIAFTNPTLTVEVVDNGKGFVPELGMAELAVHGQLGLLGMNERAQLLGGKVQIDSRPGSGTRVAITVPVPVEADHR